MNLITELRLTKTLWVKIPNTVDPAEFETDIGICVREGDSESLRDGITVEVQRLADVLADSVPDDWHAPVLDFLRAVNEHKLPDGTWPDEIFFHR